MATITPQLDGKHSRFALTGLKKDLILGSLSPLPHYFATQKHFLVSLSQLLRELTIGSRGPIAAYTDLKFPPLQGCLLDHLGQHRRKERQQMLQWDSCHWILPERRHLLVTLPEDFIGLKSKKMVSQQSSLKRFTATCYHRVSHLLTAAKPAPRLMALHEREDLRFVKLWA
jgi:hypothetical protein